MHELWGDIRDFDGRAIPFQEWPISLALCGVSTAARQLRIVRPDATYYDLSVTAVPLRSNGCVIGAVASFIDITARREAEQNLTAINKRLEEFATERARGVHLIRLIGLSSVTTADIRQMFDMTLREVCSHLQWPVGFAYAMEASSRLYGIAAWYSFEPDRYENLRSTTAAIDFSSQQSVICEVLRSRKSIFVADLEHEHHFLRKDAVRELGLRSYLAVPVIVHDHVAIILEFFHTESCRPQDFELEVLEIIAGHLGKVIEQRRAERKLQALFDSAPDAQVVSDTLGTIVMANRQTEHLFGYAEELLMGQPIELLVPPEIRTQHVGHRDKYTAHPHTRPMGTGKDLIALRRDGRRVPVEVSLSPVELEDGMFVLAAIRDVTERKKLEAELRERERLAEMGRMAAVFAHEAADPLHGIAISAQLLEKEFPGEFQSQITSLNQEISRLSSLLNEFRSFSRLEELKLATVDLTSLVQTVVRKNISSWAGSGIHVTTEFVSNVTLNADPEKLKQVIINLCRNAIQSMSQSGTLTLRTFGSTEEAGFEVGDTGPGIPEQLDIFAPFTTTKAQGTGLGLYVVKRIISAHGGTVSYSTKARAGTTFRVALPMRTHGAEYHG
jgi:PAS domain S-box-containing protein